jgi:hypothetical protein
MPMIAIFGAEVLAAEAAAAAAAEVAAAEAAAAAAAEIATAEAATVAAQQAAAQAAAQQTAQAGILEIGGATANPATLTPEAVQAAAQQAGQVAPEAVSQFTPKGSLDPSTGRFIDTTLRPEPVFQNIGGQGVTTPQTFPVNDGGITSVPQAAPSPAPPQMSYDSFGNPALQGSPAATMADPTGLAELQQAANAVPPPSGLEAGFDKALKFAEKNPFTAMTLAYTGANALGLMNPNAATFNQEKYDGPLSKYKLSPNFQAGSANPANFQYQPRYAVGGGIMGAPTYDIPVGYDKGGPVTEAQKDAAKQAFELANPNGLGPSVNVGGYGTLNFPNDAAYSQFQQNPQSMTFSQGPGGVRYAEPKAADYDTRFDNLDQNFNFGMGGGGGKGFDRQIEAEMGMDFRGNDLSSMAFAKGGSLSDSIESYQKMLSGKPQAAPARSADVGIYYDQDPDTRYQDALTAAQIRQAKVNQRAYVSPPAAKRPEPLGKLNLPTSAKSKGGGDVEAAQGGIMQSSLGGYAAGGNPRLLKGPGDGMSDNIPATINRRQPARLADGEFVIPADVVSHLGNGSTEAGAKQLYAMMNKVRKARTGNPKQGKQIKPQKYMPK